MLILKNQGKAESQANQNLAQDPEANIEANLVSKME